MHGCAAQKTIFRKEGLNMNSNYLNASERLERAKTDIKSLWEEGQNDNKGFENKQAYRILENIIENMDTAVYKLKRYSMEAIEGELLEDSYLDKFELIRNDNGKGIGYSFSCGDYLEVFDNESGEWYAGRVEHTTRNGVTGYYFYCNELGHPFLYGGLRARVRRDE